jgi:hypothetical protein
VATRALRSPRTRSPDPSRVAFRCVRWARLGVVDLLRNPVLLALLLVVPRVFVLLAKATTAARNLVLGVTEDGVTVNAEYWFPDVHAGTMTPIALASLAALAGMFVVVDAADGGACGWPAIRPASSWRPGSVSSQPRLW